MFSRQSEMIGLKTGVLHSETNWNSAFKETSQRQTFSTAFISNDQSQPSEGTPPLKIPILFSNKASRESGCSPITSKNVRTMGTPQVIILEENDLIESGQTNEDFGGKSTKVINEQSERKPFSNDDDDVSADDIVVDCGRSTEGIGESITPSSSTSSRTASRTRRVPANR